MPHREATRLPKIIALPLSMLSSNPTTKPKITVAKITEGTVQSIVEKRDR